MSNYIDINSGQVIAYADADVRQRFIRKTYAHLALAIALFALLETLFVKMGLHIAALQLVAKIGSFGFLAILLAFGFFSNIAQRWAMNSITIEKQYLSWCLGILIEAVIFLPLIGIALLYSKDVNLLQQAAIVTGALVVGLTAIVFTTGKDFSFLRPALTVGFFVALGVIVVSLLFGFTLGVFFCGAMVIFAAAAILYETSRIKYHYNEYQYVGASLSLFSSVGLLFWYVIQFMLSLSGND